MPKVEQEEQVCINSVTTSCSCSDACYSEEGAGPVLTLTNNNPKQAKAEGEATAEKKEEGAGADNAVHDGDAVRCPEGHTMDLVHVVSISIQTPHDSFRIQEETEPLCVTCNTKIRESDNGFYACNHCFDKQDHYRIHDGDANLQTNKSTDNASDSDGASTTAAAVSRCAGSTWRHVCKACALSNKHLQWGSRDNEPAAKWTECFSGPYGVDSFLCFYCLMGQFGYIQRHGLPSDGTSPNFCAIGPLCCSCSYLVADSLLMGSLSFMTIWDWNIKNAQRLEMKSEYQGWSVSGCLQHMFCRPCSLAQHGNELAARGIYLGGVAFSDSPTASSVEQLLTPPCIEQSLNLYEEDKATQPLSLKKLLAERTSARRQQQQQHQAQKANHFNIEDSDSLETNLLSSTPMMRGTPPCS